MRSTSRCRRRYGQFFFLNLQDLQEELGLTYLFIAHDFWPWWSTQRSGPGHDRRQIVEQATAEAIYANPQHPYTVKITASGAGDLRVRHPFRSGKPTPSRGEGVFRIIPHLFEGRGTARSVVEG